MTGLMKKFFKTKGKANGGETEKTAGLMEFGEFLEIAINKLKKKYPGSTAEECINPEVSKFPCIRFKHKGEVQFFGLSNAFQQYLQNPSRLNEVLDVHFKGVGEEGAAAPKNFDDLKGRILPLIKPRELVMGKKIIPVYSKMPGNLIKLYVVNLENTMMYVMEHSLKDWNKTVREIDSVAVKNLEALPERELFNHCAQLKSKSKNKVFLCDIYGYEFTSSLILAPKRLFALAKKFGLESDRAIVAIPSRENLILLDPEFEIKIIQTLADIAFNKSAYKVSKQVFELNRKGTLNPLKVK